MGKKLIATTVTKYSMKHDFGHVSDCILELLWLSTLVMFQTVFWNCCGYRLFPWFRLYFGTVVAIDFPFPKYSLKHDQSR
jgi:hypothetical protein